ncbi:GNAT family N-acetyltransferase [Actinoplanes sp. GCM10030250]|uniref:GNAT family N-acetyltransferase n=1 Tax=Actinoplanes sp. GCM10030250 TaxID=3273376 RepID=UPI00360F30E5
MKIRAMTPGDEAFEQAATLFDEYRVHYGEVSDPLRTREWLAEQLTVGRLRMAVAADGARLGGLITSAVLPASLRLGAAWSVRDLFVAPDHRRAGIARTLLDHVVAEARAAGALRVSLVTEPENGPALGLYRAAGFRPVEGLAHLSLTLGKR